MGRKIIRDARFALMQADFLIATNPRDDLDTAKAGWGNGAIRSWIARHGYPTSKQHVKNRKLEHRVVGMQIAPANASRSDANAHLSRSRQIGVGT